MANFSHFWSQKLIPFHQFRCRDSHHRRHGGRKFLARIPALRPYSSDALAMKLLHQDGMISGFWATEIDPLVPDIIDCGETRHRYRSRVGPHLHGHWELYYQIAGKTKHHSMDGRKFILKPGSVLCVGPDINHWHEHVSRQPVHALFVGFDLTAVATRHPEWDVFGQFGQIFSIDGAHQLERSMRRVLEEATIVLSQQSSGLRLALDMLVLDVMRASSHPVGARSSVAKHPAVLRAIHLLETRFREPWGLDEIAEYVEMSRAHFATLFQQNTGIPLHKFLTRVRITHAEQLLRNSEESCESIAKECGFTTSQHFTRAFKLHTGLTPIRFRQKYRTPSGPVASESMTS
jgi:AraC-like DNA-binding protein/mannose-6-phosphate isomerase-like protein (cupin superfamily)